MSRELRERRTAAAREAMKAIQGYDAIANDDDRSAAVYARLLEDIQKSFADHSPNGDCCFNLEQRACIEDISFHVSLVFDAKDRQPKNEVVSIIRHIKSLSPFEKWGVIFGIIGSTAVTIVTVVGWAVSAYGYLHPTAAASTVVPGRAATIIERTR